MSQSREILESYIISTDHTSNAFSFKKGDKANVTKSNHGGFSISIERTGSNNEIEKFDNIAWTQDYESHFALLIIKQLVQDPKVTTHAKHF